ncbi:hypothetical protein D9M69_325850 [compost metagenome]
MELGLDHRFDIRNEFFHPDSRIGSEHLFVDVRVQALVQRFGVSIEAVHRLLDIAHFRRRQGHINGVDEIEHELIDLLFIAHLFDIFDVIREVFHVLPNDSTHLIDEDT